MSYDVTVGPSSKPPMEPFEAGSLTYNLGTMMRRAGIHPVVMNGLNAEIARSVISNALFTLKENPDYFKPMAPVNGWGTYDGLIDWLEKLYDYLVECPPNYVVEWR